MTDSFPGPVYTASDVNVIRRQYEHKSAEKHVMWRRLSSRHARTHCARSLWSDLAEGGTRVPPPL